MDPEESVYHDDESGKREFWLWKITGPIGLISGLGFAVMAIFNVWSTVQVGDNTAIAEATVVSAKNVRSGDSYTRELGYEFNDHKGIPRYGEGNVSHYDRPRVGNIVLVRFNVDDPNYSVLAEENEDVTMAVICSLLALMAWFWKPIVFLLNLLPFVTVRATEVDDWPQV